MIASFLSLFKRLKKVPSLFNDPPLTNPSWVRELTPLGNPSSFVKTPHPNSGGADRDRASRLSPEGNAHG
ncbi:MAG: hypothetical protein ACJAT6_001331 [Akkermansiaceae bacterium]|jgi:hypothetical protein